MNITKSSALAVSVFLCFFVFNSNASSLSMGDEKKAKTELIIVNVDQETNSQLSDLAQYVHDIYKANKGGLVTIKTYMNMDMGQSTIDNLVIKLVDSGIKKTDIEVIEEDLRLNNPYFTLSVSTRPFIQ